MSARKSLRLPIVIFVGLASCLFVSAADAKQSKQEKAQQRALSAITKKLPVKGQDKEKTWYVIQFEILTSSTSYSGSTKTTRVNSSVRTQKIQGQAAAAKAILEFLQAPAPGKKIFYRDAFSDTDAGRRGMEKHLERLRLVMAARGYQ